MPSLLYTIANNPLYIRDYLYNHLEEICIKTNSKHYINHPINNMKAFSWAHVVNRCHDIPDAFIYKFNRMELFYAFVFDDYTDAQIRQLESALTFIERLFNVELIEFDKSCKILSMGNKAECSCPYFNISYKDDIITFNNKDFSFIVNDLSFDNFYIQLLTAFKDKFCKFLDKSYDEITIYDLCLFNMMKI